MQDKKLRKDMKGVVRTLNQADTAICQVVDAILDHLGLQIEDVTAVPPSPGKPAGICVVKKPKSKSKDVLLFGPNKRVKR